MILRGFASVARSWNQFWFESDRERVLKVFRSALGIWLLAFYLVRSLDLRFFFSESGLIPQGVMTGGPLSQWRLSVFDVFSSDRSLLVGNAVFMLSLFAMAIGKWPRLAPVVALVLHISFLHRNVAIVYGIDLIASYLLFALAMAWTRELRSVALRLIQIQVCVIYLYSGLEKLKGSSWWSGDALWRAIANASYARFDLGWLSHFPVILIIATQLTLLWEIYFPVLVWNSRWRNRMLIFGVVVHAGIALTVHITFFAGLMVLTYLTFLSDREGATLLRGVERLFSRFRPRTFAFSSSSPLRRR